VYSHSKDAFHLPSVLGLGSKSCRDCKDKTGHIDTTRCKGDILGEYLQDNVWNPIQTDQAFVAEFLQEEKVLLVQGSGFNWVKPDHFRLVFLPNEDILREAIMRLGRFLKRYRERSGTDSLVS
jgi:hypothetical protein